MHGQQVWIIWYKLTKEFNMEIEQFYIYLNYSSPNYIILNKSFGTLSSTITQPFQSLRNIALITICQVIPSSFKIPLSSVSFYIKHLPNISHSF